MQMKHCILLVPLLASFAVYSQPQQFVGTRGADIIAPDGTPLLLRGINLGNWLVPEG